MQMEQWTKEKLMRKKLFELQKLCLEHELSQTGAKAILANRLMVLKEGGAGE